jgi:glucokinase
LDAVTDVVLAFDVGGTAVTAGLVTATGEVLWSIEAATVHTDRGRDPGLQQLAGLVRQLRQEAAAHDHAVRAVTLGFPEYADHDRLTSTEVIAWDRQPAEVLGDDLDDVPLFVESDVRCAAMAEAQMAAADEHDLFYVSWGSGISSTLVINGVCRAGRRGEAIALGEFDVPATIDPTWTANLEQFASGVGIARRYAALHPGAAFDGRAVAERADAGDVDATAIVRSAARAVAAALRSCIAILDPDVVVLGGGIGAAADGVVVTTCRAELDDLLTRAHPPAVVSARLGSRAGLIGAGLTGWQRLAAALSFPAASSA